MSKPFKFPLATSTWDQAEFDAMNRVINSGMFTMGQEVAFFEKEFAEHIGSKFAVMVNSGSSANLLMVAALIYRKQNNLQPGDEIIVPAVSWSTSYYPFSQYGLKLKFVDIDLETLNYSLPALQDAVSDQTRAILAVNLLGNPNDFNQLQKIIDGRNIILLEDNCESLGASYNGKMAGTYGLIGTFSTFFSHHISTMEGGILVTDDEELYHIILCLRAHGWTRNLPERNLVSNKSLGSFDESFRFVLPGYNLRPLEISGAIGREQIKKINTITSGRRANAKFFIDQMSAHPDFLIQKEIGESSWFGFSLIIKKNSSWDRFKLIDRLSYLGFEVRPVVAGNFVNNEVIRYLPHTIHGNLKNASYLHQNGLFIGNHHFDISEAIQELRGL